MPGLNKNRKRPVTIAFRVTALEAQRINQRVKMLITKLIANTVFKLNCTHN